MKRSKIISAFVACLTFSTGAARPATLIFIPQIDLLGNANNDWSSVDNWFLSDSVGGLVKAGRLPGITDTAATTNHIDAATNAIQINALILEAGASVTNGNFLVEYLRMSRGTMFIGSGLTVETEMDIMGANCVLNGAALTIESGAFALCQSAPTAERASLMLSFNSEITNRGDFILTDKTSLKGGPACRFVNRPGATLYANGASLIQGIASLIPFTFDNSGTVQAESGTLQLSGPINWESSRGTARFKTAA